MKFLDRPSHRRRHRAGKSALALGAAASGATASGATALGALAIGSLAVGALAIGALAIGRLAVGKARVRSLEIGDLRVGNLTVGQNEAAKTDKPAIARIWRGRTTRERADEYEAYLLEAGTRPLIEKALGVQNFREDRDTETEFMTISYWESVEAMARFTGGDPTKIHHLPRDEEFLIELPKRVQVLTMLVSHGDKG